MDVEKILAPFGTDAPTGVDLRDQPADLSFKQIQEDRTEVLPEDDPSGAGREPNWAKVARHCEEVLSETSKDLQLAVWLAEAVARSEGFQGLHASLRMLTELTERFWENLHPGCDPEMGVILPVRARYFSWLGSSREFLRAAAMCPLAPPGPGGLPLSWEDYRTTSLVDEKRGLSDSGPYEDMKAAGLIDSEEWNSRFDAIPVPALRTTVSEVMLCQEALGELRALCDKKFGSDEAPNFVGLGEMLMELREYLEARLPDEEEVAAAAEEQGEGSEENAASPGASGPLGNREDALRRLAGVAEYFRRTEPHSPISYLVDRAVRWGHMPLMEVLQEFIEDPSALARIQSNLGIRGDS